MIAGGLINFSALANFGTGRVVLNGGGVQWAAGNTIDISPRLDPIGSSGGTFDTNGNNVTLGTGISGGGGITKAGSGTLTLTGVNTYQGGTTINAGTISVAANNNLGSGALAFGGGTLQTMASFAMLRATTLNSGGTFDVASGTTLTHGGVIGGTGGLTKTGGGTLVLTAVNTYQGGTTINAGTLELSDSGSIASSSLVDLAAAGASFDISPSTINQTIQDLRGVAGSRVRLGDNSLTLGTANSTTFAGIVDAGPFGLGTGGLIKQGSGTLTLTGANTYTGGTTITGGLINFTTLGNFGTGNVTLDGGGVQWAAGNTIDISTRLSAIDSNGGTFDTNGNNVTLATAISGTGGITKVGNGTLTLSGINTYGGATAINGGTLALSGNGSIASSSGVNLAAAGATFDIAGSTGNQTIQDLSGGAGSIVTLGANSLTVGSMWNMTTFDGVIGGTGGLIKQRYGTLILTGANTYTGGTTITGGTLKISADNNLGEASGALTIGGTSRLMTTASFTISRLATLNGGLGAFDVATGTTLTYSGAIGGTGNLGKYGGGTMVLTNVSTYSGQTLVEAGTLALSGAGSIAASSSLIMGGFGGIFDISQTTGGASISLLQSLGVIEAGVIKLGAKTLTVTTGGYFYGTIQDGGLGGGAGGGLSLASGASLSLYGTNTYAGATTIDANATLELSGSGSLASSSGVHLAAAGATFNIAGSSGNQTIQDLAGVAGSLVTLGANSLTAGTSNSTTFGGVINGDGGFTKQGSGTLVFTGNNAYTGVTTVSAGTLQLGNGGTSGTIAGNVAIASGAILAFNRSDDIVFGGSISGDGAVSYRGPGLVTVTGTSSYTGGTAVTGGGGVQIGSDAALGATGSVLTLSDGAIQATASFTSTRAITLGAGGGIVDTNNFDLSLMGAIGGGGSLTKSGNGTLFLGGANIYGGGTTVLGGVLLGTTTSLQGNIVNDATVGFSQSTDGVYAGNISGSGKLIKTGAGTVTLTGTNTYAGGTTVSGGVLLGTTSSLQGNIVNNASVGFAQGTDGVYAGNMSGTGGLTKTGAGRVMLTGTNTYAGGTVVSGGALFGTAESLQGNIVNNAAVGFDTTSSGTYAGTMSGSGVLAAFGAGTLILTGNNTYTGGTAIAGGSVLQLGNGGTTGMIAGNVDIESGGVLAFNRSDNISFAGNIGGGGAVAYVGPGIVTLTGVNTYTGGTAIVGGIVQAGSDSVFGTAGAMLTLAGGTIQATASFSIARPITLAGPGGTFDTNGNALTLAGAITGTGALVKVGAGNLILSGANDYSGGTTVSGGTLTGTTTSLQGDITNNSAVVFNQTTSGTYAGVMSGTGNLTKTGAGTLILTANNTYTGGTIITGGILQLGNGGTTGMIAGDVINNGVLAFNRSDNVVFAGNISGSGSISYMGRGTVTLTGSSTYTGGTAISRGTVQAGSDSAFGAAGTTLTVVGGTIQATASFTIARPITLTTPGGTFDTNGNTLTLQGAISGTGGLTKTGTGTLILTGTNSYTGGTTVTAGILQGTTSSLQRNIVNNAAVVFDQSTDGSYGSVLSGTGSLTKAGSGNLTLTGTNTYTGGTTVSGGTLTGSTTNLQGNIVNNAAVVFDQDTNGTYAGVLLGTGGLTKTGYGNVTLTGANRYSGGTTVSGGMLTGNTTSLQGNIVNNSAVVFNQGTDGTYAGIMSGTGGLTKSGAGNLTLSGANSYSGGTTVSGGTLIGTTSSLQGNILNNAALVFDQATTGTYAGVITGTGSLTKTGAGLLNLTGNNVVGGGTTVSGGVLAVNGSMTSNVTVTNGGALGGNGQLIGALAVNGGTVAPGNSIGTMTVTGNFSQTGGVYQVEVNSAGQNDKIVATGTATINGGTVQVLAASGTYQRNTTYTIVSATGGLSGTYSGVSSNLAFLTPSLSYDANNVYLLLAQTANAFAAGARTRDQYAVGTALDIASPTATGDFNTVLNALAALTAQQGPAALDAISGQPYADFGSVNVGASLTFMNTLGQQIAAARGGGIGTRVALAEACEIACDTADLPKWGAWISGLGGFGSIGGNANAGTLTYNLGGVAVGADYRFDPRFLVGLAFGYSSGRQWVSGFQGNGNSDNYSAALYASFNQGGLYVDALAGYAYSDNRLQRVMQIPGLATRYANGGTGANQFLGQIEAGYKIGLYEAAQATITPFARFQSVAVSQNAFGESGAQSLNLSVAQQNTTSVRTVIGADFGANIPVGLERPLAITLRLGWAHEYADTARPMTAAFAGAPTAAFTVYGSQPLRDAAVIGFGLNAQIGASTSLYARYDGEITGRDDSHAISAGLRMTW